MQAVALCGGDGTQGCGRAVDKIEIGFREIGAQVEILAYNECTDSGGIKPGDVTVAVVAFGL